MNESMITGLFTLAGALLAGTFTYMGTRVDHRWSLARREIADLCDQVKAYHKLEALYADELSAFKKSHKKSVLQEMRSKVEAGNDLARPTLTAAEAEKIQRRWQ